MLSSSDCPKCKGPRDAKDLYCPFCGAVFSRLEGAANGATPGLAPAGPGGLASRGAQPPSASPWKSPAPERPSSSVNPYQAPAASVAPRERPVTWEKKPPQEELGRRFARLAAQILDGLIIGGAFAAGIMVMAVLGGETSTEEDVMAWMAIVALFTVLPIGLYNLHLLHSEGQTLGKKALKLRIVRTTGEQAGLGRIVLLRILAPSLIGMIPVLGSFFSLIDALMIFGDQRRCLHDHFADTKVVVA